MACELKKQYFSNYARETRYVDFVTIDHDGFPVIRSIGSFGVDGYHVYLSTGRTTGKVSQIANNNKISLLFQHEGQEISSYVNVALRGIAELLSNVEEIQKAVEVIAARNPGYLDRVAKVGLENLAIYKITPVEIKVLDLAKNASGRALEVITEF